MSYCEGCAALEKQLREAVEERDDLRAQSTQRLIDLEAANKGRQAAADANVILDTAAARMRRSLGFLTGILEDLADELGLAREDVAGIVRAVKARDGAALRARELEAQVAEMAANRQRLVDSNTAAIEIIRRIGALTKAEPAETVEAAVERVIAGWNQALAKLERIAPHRHNG